MRVKLSMVRRTLSGLSSITQKQKASPTPKKLAAPRGAMLLSGTACGLCAKTATQAFAFWLAGGSAGFGVALAGEAITRVPNPATTHSTTLVQDFFLSVMVTDRIASRSTGWENRGIGARSLFAP